MSKNGDRNGLEIAIIGMSGRFPGAGNLHEFWENLKNGVNSICYFRQEELLQNSNINPDEIKQPNYVKAKGIIDNIEYFDAAFFGYSPGEAELLDPQVRLFYEICWEALEDAACDPSTYNGSIAVYAGGSSNLSWEVLSIISGKLDSLGQFSSGPMANKDYLSTRISFKLDLKGPAISMNTACSTALVGLDLACRGLLTGQCDAALVGGVSVTTETTRGGGYLYEEGFVHSPDAHVRTFDARAKGTIFSHGAGVVLLKRLDDATADGDNIYAVIKGFAVNNDGMNKSSFAAPSVQGQTQCIRIALELSELDPETITYIEAHGTATELGDVIEINALTTAFNTNKKQYCAIGSLKTNIGHLDSAAGIAGLIKVALMIKHRQIPPSLNYEIPNPNIDFENSPFFVNTRLQEWKSNGYPLRAGVSSFGVGGTNAHVILEEWTGDSEPGGKPSRPYQLLLFSARNTNALEQMTGNLLQYLKTHANVNLADVAYSLKPGRKTFEHRRMLVCSTAQEAIDILESSEPVKRNPSKEEDIPSFHTFYGREEKQVVFMFPGQRSQYVNMTRGIYETEAIFRKEIDRCFEILKPLMEYDLKEILYPSAEGHRSYRSNESYIPPIDQTEIAQPVIFVIEYALAKLLMSWGIVPDAMMGHSIGEYVAACLSGVFSLEDALYIVSQRGKLMQQMPPGKMLSVTLTEQELKPLLINNSELNLAAVNGSFHCVVSGPPEAIDAFTRQLEKNSHQYRLLHTSKAYHSKMMDPILKPFAQVVAKVKPHIPRIPFISNVSGSWITYQEAADPGYWVKHLRQTVRIVAGLSELLKDKQTIFIEVGPGCTLSTFVRQLPGKQHEQHKQMVVNLVPHPNGEAADEYYILSKLGQVWLYGKEPDWQGFYPDEKRHKLRLPTYPFQRQRFWLEGNPGALIKKGLKGRVVTGKKPDIADWFYIPSWKRSVIYNRKKKQKQEQEVEKNQHQWLILAGDNDSEFASQLLLRINHEHESQVTVIRPGETFSKGKKGHYTINPCKESDYKALIKMLHDSGGIPTRIVHLWNLNVPSQDDDQWQLESQGLEKALHWGFYSLLYLVKALGNWGILENNPEIHIIVVTNGMQEVFGEKVSYPQKALVQGPIMTIPLEYPGIKCCCIDIDSNIICPATGDDEYRKNKQQWLMDQLLKEFSTGVMGWDVMIAYREEYRLVRCFEPAPLSGSGSPVLRLNRGDIYLISGGLGGIGLVIARHLAETLKPKLILTGRSTFPAKNQWEQWLDNHDSSDITSRKILKIQELESLGAEVRIYSVDSAHQEKMHEVLAEIKHQYGTIHGVIHAAGVFRRGLSQIKTREQADKVLLPKVKGTIVLHRTLQQLGIVPDFMVLFSSISSVVPAPGLMDYLAANAFMDAFAFYKNKMNKQSTRSTFTISINWDTWQEVGMGVEEVSRKRKDKMNPTQDFDRTPDQQDPLKDAISNLEGIEAFNRILIAPFPQVAVSTLDLAARLEDIRELTSADLAERITSPVPQGTLHPRPEISTPYEAPIRALEQQLAGIWQMILGIDQVGIADDFFELGGDSLKAAVMITRIYKELNVKILIEEIFRTPHIKGLAQSLSKSEEHTYVSITKAEKKEYYPLSELQKRLYILNSMEGIDTAYNLSHVMEIQGIPDRQHLEQGFQSLIQRHEILRTTFKVTGREPVQIIHEQADFHIDFLETREKNIETTIKKCIRPFNLTAAPLVRLALITLSPVKHMLVFDIHHIISDGSSLAIMVKDFVTLYDGRELPALQVQYKDFSQWEKSELRKQETKKQENYWLNNFKGEIPRLELLTDFPRPPLQVFAGETITFIFQPPLTRELEQLEKETGTTLYMVLLAAFTILLAKFSGQEDIIIGSPTAGRDRVELENIPGLFINVLALRNFPTPSKTFKEFLNEVKNNTLKAYENQVYPFGELIKKLDLTRDLSRNPLYDAELILQNMETPILNLGNLTSTRYPYDPKISQHDISLSALEIPGEISFHLSYCTKLFKRETIEKFIEFFKQIISTAVENKEIKIQDIKAPHTLEQASANVPGIEEIKFGF
jgi:acyl transferase domain-containing protein/acyl carrier protein